MASIKIIAVAAAVIAMFVVAATAEEEAVSCREVDSALGPCLRYLVNGGEPGEECCKGVEKLEGMTPTTEDRRTACECVKEAALRNKNIKDEAAKELPSKCKITVKIPISKDVDCNTMGRSFEKLRRKC